MSFEENMNEREELLEGKSLEAGAETVSEEVKPVKKPRLPLIFAGLISVTFILVLAAIVFLLPGKGADSALQPATLAACNQTPERMESKISHSTQGVSFDVSADWTQETGTDLFYTADRGQIYGLNGVSPLGSYTPQEFYENLVSYYQTSNQFTSLDAPDSLQDWRSGDGVTCQVANLTGYKGTLLYCTRLVIVPQKNLVLTFCGQAYTNAIKDPDFVWYPLNLLCESLTFEIGSQDYISGNTFLCGDGSQLCLRDDNSFRYYQSSGDHENQYYEGIYEVYRGQAAMDKAVSMTEYGLTMEELERGLSANMNGYIPGGSKPSDYLYSTGELEENRTRYDVCLDTFYAVILNNQRLVRSPGDIREGGNSTLYLGFYLPELGMADLVNCNAATYTQWTFQDKTR